MSYQRVIYGLIGVVLGVCVHGQNLVLNPSFEDTVACPTALGQLDKVMFWTNPNSGTPDYYHSCYEESMPITSPDVPQNWGGGQYPVDGEAYVGVASFCSPGCEEVREYVQGQLSTPLLAGETYCVEFYVSLGDTFQYATDGLGLYFSDTLVHTMPAAPALPFTPQIDAYFDSVIIDKLSWTKISGTYEAQGGEQYLLIGCFKDFAALDVDTLTGYHDDAYYYVDMVSVETCVSSVPKVPGASFISVYPNPTTGTVSFDYVLETEQANLTVYDVTGKVVRSSTLAGYEGTATLDLNELNEGMYFYTVTTDNEMLNTGKLVINR